MSTKLPIDLNPCGLFLVDDIGSPVWPIAESSDIELLTRVAELHGASVMEVHGTRAVDGRSSDTVVALGRQVLPAARLYGHLTGRTVEVVQSLPELVRGVLPRVVVCLMSDVSPELLESLYAADLARTSEVAPGLIIGETPEALERQVKARSAALWLSGQRRMWRACIDSELDAFTATGATGIVAGAKAPPHKLKEIMGSGHSLLWMTGHSDGITEIGRVPF